MARVRHQPVVQHAMATRHGQRYSFTLVHIRYVKTVATGHIAMLDHAFMATWNDPHTAVVDGRVVESQPAADHGIGFVYAEIIVILVPVDFIAVVRRFVHALAYDEAQVGSEQTFDRIQQSLVAHDRLLDASDAHSAAGKTRRRCHPR